MTTIISRFLYFIVPLILVCTACVKNSHSTSTSDAKKIKPTVIVAVVKSQLLLKQLSYPARVVPKVNVAVLSEIDGVVTRIYVEFGQYVKKYQELVDVQHNEPGYQYRPMPVRSPISGIISSADINPGASIIKGQKLVGITDPKQIYVAIEVPATDLNSISTGLEGDFLLPALLPQTIPVKITGLSPLIDLATGTASADLHLLHSKDLVYLKPGLLGEVSFNVNKHSGIEIPESALVYRSKDTIVRLVQDGKIKETIVSLGETHKGNVEVMTGLNDKEVIVLRSSNFLTDGSEVTVEKKDNNKQ